MQRTIKRTVKATTLLENAKPVFVSLVKHGANQTPFRTIKSDDPATPMSKPTTVKKGLNLDSGVEIGRITFKGENFKDEATIKAFLDDNGFSNYLIEAKGDDFEVPGIDSSEFEGELAAIEVDTGVTAFVGKLKSSAEPEQKGEGAATSPNTAAAPAAGTEGTQKGAEATPPARTRTEGTQTQKGEGTTETPVFLKTTKGESLVKKWSYCASYYSNGKTLADVMKDASEDGIPLGYHEVLSSFTQAIGNNLKANDVPAIKGLVAELGEYLTKLAELTADVSTKSEKDEWAAAFAQTDKTPEPEQKGEGTATTQKSEGEGDTTAKALEAMEKRIKALEDAQAESSKKSEAIGGRILKLEKVRQTRKSADVGDLAPESPATEPVTKTNEPVLLSKRDRNLLGVRD